MSKLCAKCEKIVYPTEEVKCLDKVCKIWAQVFCANVRRHFAITRPTTNFSLHSSDKGNTPPDIYKSRCLSRLSQTDGTLTPVCQTQTGQADLPFSLSRHVLGRPDQPVPTLCDRGQALNEKRKTKLLTATYN